MILNSQRKVALYVAPAIAWCIGCGLYFEWIIRQAPAGTTNRDGLPLLDSPLVQFFFGSMLGGMVLSVFALIFMVMVFPVYIWIRHGTRAFREFMDDTFS